MELDLSVEIKIDLNLDEAKELLNCMDYCYHRLEKHKHTGLHRTGVNIKYIDNIRCKLRKLIHFSNRCFF